MTWKEFKETLEEDGVTDEMKIEYIDFDGYLFTLNVDKANNTFVLY